jgi:transposase
VRCARVWKRLIGVDDRTVIEDVEFADGDETVVVHVRPRRPKRRRCGRCERPAPGYDLGEGRRRWRGLDLGTVRVELESDAPRVACGEHGVTVAAVPWARHGARFTRDFEDQTAWLATHTSKWAITQLLRVAWVTVGRIIAERGAGSASSAVSHRLTYSTTHRSSVFVSTALTMRSHGTLSKNSRMSKSSTQSVFIQRCRHTPTASSADRFGR